MYHSAQSRDRPGEPKPSKNPVRLNSVGRCTSVRPKSDWFGERVIGLVEFVGDIDTIDTFSYKTTMIQLENTIENVSEKKQQH